MSKKKFIQLSQSCDSIEITGDHLDITMRIGSYDRTDVTTLRAEQAEELAAALLEFASKVKFR